MDASSCPELRDLRESLVKLMSLQVLVGKEEDWKGTETVNTTALTVVLSASAVILDVARVAREALNENKVAVPAEVALAFSMATKMLKIALPKMSPFAGKILDEVKKKQEETRRKNGPDTCRDHFSDDPSMN